jgi:predicted nuclease with RNAse H fold
MQARTRTKTPKVGTDERHALAADVAIAYKRGDAIRQICADTGHSYGLVHKLLDEAGITFRPRGGANRKEK